MIKNYTTTVDVGNTVGQIQKILVKAGANAILNKFGQDGVMESVCFEIETSHGKLTYQLPANIDGVEKCLIKQKVAPRLKTREHAARVAWRIIKDWLDAQMAIIESEMVDAKQVFLPYMVVKDGNTLYEMLEEKDFKLLGEGKDE